jgi:hypothetical protein
MMLTKLTVSGSHYDCGQQIGRACATGLYQSLANNQKWIAAGYRWDDYRTAAQPYLAATEQAFPWVVDEIRGAASGAGLDFLDLFTVSIEELYSTPPELLGRCSDFAACSPATEGHVLLGHNNDLPPSTENLLTAVEWHLPDHPRLFTVGVGGLFPSIGLNSAKVCLTGNELSPNDEKPGIPRLLVARALLAASTFSEAVSIALHPNRASSYNNLISQASGEMASVEASATDHELLPPCGGWLVHTNHYTHPRMQKYERDFHVIDGSISRYNRAVELMQNRKEPVTLELFKSFLADHSGSPATLCRHAERVKTVFSCLIDLTAGAVEATVGNPCEGQFEPLWSF